MARSHSLNVWIRVCNSVHTIHTVRNMTLRIRYTISKFLERALIVKFKRCSKLLTAQMEIFSKPKEYRRPKQIFLMGRKINSNVHFGRDTAAVSAEESLGKPSKVILGEMIIWGWNISWDTLLWWIRKMKNQLALSKRCKSLKCSPAQSSTHATRYASRETSNSPKKKKRSTSHS